MLRARSLPLVGLLSLALLSCHRTLPAAHEVEDPSRSLEGHLGVHLIDGDLVVLESWRGEGEPPRTLTGYGTRYGPWRRAGTRGTFRLPYDSIVLLETAVPEPLDPMIGEGLGATGLAVYTVLTGAITLTCLADPKACFGSCPTLYTDADADRPVAEAFSGSIARAFEARDVDALPTVRPRDGVVRLIMRNEALETHAVRSLRLLAVPAGPAGSAATDDGFFALRERHAPVACSAREGDCLASLRTRDGVERRSWTDSADLATREVVELVFPAPDGAAGVLISARHTFVSTFVFYQMMAYLGRNGGGVLAAVEREAWPRLTAAFERGVDLLGDIEVQLRRGGEWATVGTLTEAGPLAADEHLIPLPDVPTLPAPGEPVHVRLVLTRGYWRLDEVALAELGPRVRPRAVRPSRVWRTGAGASGPSPAVAPGGHRTATGALAALRDPDRYLITWPGDAYTLEFDVGEANEVLFLDATGYYYEWMREEWLEEESPAMIALFMARPRTLFRRLAPAFKRSERHMESLFWSSRFGRGE